jgi:hypothetical protein
MDTKSKRRLIALIFLGTPLLGLSVVRVLAYLTASFQIDYWGLVGHLLITVLAVVGVELLLEDFSLREKDKDLEDCVKQIGEKLHLLDRDEWLGEIVRLQTDEWKKLEPLIEARNTYGLEWIYSSRSELKQKILEDLRVAKDRIWLLAITFSRDVSLDDEMLKVIKAKIAGGVDVKILAANAIRSIAVFRTFLEISNNDDQDMIQTDGFKRYFDHRFYTKFIDLFRRLDRVARDTHALRKIVRFYPHSPSCWLVCVDGVLYYQPYVLGRIHGSVSTKGTAAEEALTIGDLMPVFKFAAPTKKPFQSLLNHFEELWFTSDVDLFHMGARVENKEFRLQRIFKERFLWFQHVVEALRVPKDNRHYPRKLYRIDPSFVRAAGDGNEHSVEPWMYWTLRFSEGPLKAFCPLEVKMEDVSYNGCAIRVNADNAMRELFSKYSDTARECQASGDGSENEYLEIPSYYAKYISDLHGVASLAPPNVTDLRELDYLVRKMREYCNLEFRIQNWNWDHNNPQGDLLIGMQYKQEPRRV